MNRKIFLGLIILGWLSINESLANSSQYSIPAMPCWQNSCSDTCLSIMAKSILEANEQGRVSSGVYTIAVINRYCEYAGDALLKQYKSKGYTKVMRDVWVKLCRKSVSREKQMKSFLNGLAAALYSDAENAAVNTNITFSDGNFLSALNCILPYKANLGNLTYNPALNPNCTVIEQNIKNYMSISINRSNSSVNSLKAILNFYANNSGILSCTSYVKPAYAPSAVLSSSPSMISTDMSNSAENSISGSSVNISPASLSPASITVPVITKPVVYTNT